MWVLQSLANKKLEHRGLYSIFIWGIISVSQLNSPLKILILDLPVRQKSFGASQKRGTDDHFLSHFYWENVYQGKMEKLCTQARPECAIKRKCGPLKITKNFFLANLGHHIRMETINNWPVRKVSEYFRGGIKLINTVIKLILFDFLLLFLLICFRTTKFYLKKN